MTNKLHANFQRDLIYLNQNQIPMEPSGLKIDKLDYEGSSDDEKERLDDSHIEQLAEALMCNDVFQGPLDLSKNDLTDQVSKRKSLTYLCSVCSLPEQSTFLCRQEEHHQDQHV